MSLSDKELHFIVSCLLTIIVFAPATTLFRLPTSMMWGALLVGFSKEVYDVYTHGSGKVPDSVSDMLYNTMGVVVGVVLWSLGQTALRRIRS